MSRILLFALTLIVINIQLLGQSISDVQLYYLKTDPCEPPVEWDSLYLLIEEYLELKKQYIDMTVSGKVMVEAIINKDGFLSNVKIYQGVKFDYDSLALEAVKSLPKKWEPAYSNGKFIDQRVIFPISFNSSYDDNEIESSIPHNNTNPIYSLPDENLYNLVSNEISGKIRLNGKDVKDLSDAHTFISFQLGELNEISSFQFIKGNKALYELIEPQLLDHYPLSKQDSAVEYVILGILFYREN